MIATARHYGICTMQLHGEESPEVCQMLQAEGFCVIKAFALDAHFEMNSLLPYEAVCDYFLFDTKGAQKGGNGVAFDWRVLDAYQLSKPFFLSGGIGWEQIEDIKALLATKAYPLYALDLNSRLESRSGYKDEALSKKVIAAFKYGRCIDL
jgi:phosphoribosylanthranilate isomerase